MDHSFFPQYKDKFKSKTAILMASGATLSKFKDDFPHDFLRVGVNGVILHENIRKSLDIYIWAGDLDTKRHPTPSAGPIQNTIPLLPKHTLKFTNSTINGSSYHPTLGQTQINKETATKLGFHNYDIVFGRSKEHPIDIWYKDIENYGLDAVSVIFPAMQILLYMGITTIYLVGCDCGGHHSYKNMIKNDKCDWGLVINKPLVNRWILFKKFMTKYYPKTEVKVIRPVGLKNIFEELS